MGNENLKNALEAAGLTIEQLAEVIGVDPKSVQRWVSGTTVPYPRHRAAISQALNIPEPELWPDEKTGQLPNENKDENDGQVARSDVTGAWAYADDQGAPELVAFITDTTGPVDVLDSACGIELTPEVVDALRLQADAGRPVRILTDGSAPRWEPLLGHPEVELYLAEIPGEYWLIKTPDRMLVTINFEHEPEGAPPPPILELVATGDGGVFDRFAGKFEELWELTNESEPLSDPGPASVSPTPGRENDTGTDGPSDTDRDAGHANPTDRLVLSDPDQHLMLFVAANEVVLAEQAAALLQISPQDAAGRLEQLLAKRLVSLAQLSSQLPAAYRITRAGAEQIDSFLPPLRALDMHGYRHEIAIGWLWASARHGQLGDLREVLTRREMQAADATLRSESLLDTPGARFSSSPVTNVQSDARRTYPDLGLVQATGGWATLDVVLSLPKPRRLRTMLGRYSHDRLVRAQLYLAEPDQGIDDAITAMAAELGLSNEVHVQRLAQDGIAGA